MNVVSTKNIEIIDSSMNDDVERDDKILDQIENNSIGNNKKEKKGERRISLDITVIKKEVAKELSCRNTCRCRGIGIFMLLIAVIIFMAIVTIQFTSNMDGPFALLSTKRFVWVFLVLTIMYILLALWIIIRWKPNMKEWIEENYNNREICKKILEFMPGPNISSPLAQKPHPDFEKTSRKHPKICILPRGPPRGNSNLYI